MVNASLHLETIVSFQKVVYGELLVVYPTGREVQRKKMVRFDITLRFWLHRFPAVAGELREATKEGQPVFSKVILRQFPDWMIGRESVWIKRT
jgi:hypothetical protein